ncbi:hypothetical protein EDD11_001993 [Mortierella claussenii]|nr:hypothetical protein EDD11_001993 [Mortierella claussenii]
MAGVQYLKTLLEPVELRHKNGEKSFGLRSPGFKTDNAWSGLKVGAFVFHQLFNGQHKTNKAEVQSCMEEALKQCKDKPCKILDIVGQILNVMAEEEGAPVSKEVNKHLTELAPKLSSEIWTLNKDKVLPAIVKRIDEVLR